MAEELKILKSEDTTWSLGLKGFVKISFQNDKPIYAQEWLPKENPGSFFIPLTSKMARGIAP